VVLQPICYEERRQLKGGRSGGERDEDAVRRTEGKLCVNGFACCSRPRRLPGRADMSANEVIIREGDAERGGRGGHYPDSLDRGSTKKKGMREG